MQVGWNGVRGATQENLSVAAVVVVAVVVVVVVVMDCFILSQVILLCYHDLRLLLFLMTPAELDTPIKILLASEFKKKFWSEKKFSAEKSTRRVLHRRRRPDRGEARRRNLRRQRCKRFTSLTYRRCSWPQRRLPYARWWCLFTVNFDRRVLTKGTGGSYGWPPCTN